VFACFVIRPLGGFIILCLYSFIIIC